MDLLFLLSAVSEVIAGIFYCKKEIVQNNRQIFKQFSAGMREQEKIQIALSAVMVCWPSFLSLSVLQNSNIRNMLFMNNFVYLIWNKIKYVPSNKKKSGLHIKDKYFLDRATKGTIFCSLSCLFPKSIIESLFIMFLL